MCAWVFLPAAQALLWLLLMIVDILLGILYYPLRRLRHSRRGLRTTGNEFSASALKTVVIVGGNFAGLAAVRELEGHSHLRVVLIDKRQYFEYTPGVLRLFCDASLYKTLVRPMPDFPHIFLCGTVTSIQHDHVIVASGTGGASRIEFDYLVLAMGADYREPITPSASEVTLASRGSKWHAEMAKMKAAESVLVLGGGAVGTELAAEVACHFPQKRVTLVDGCQDLVPMFPKKTVDYTRKWFEDHGVELVLGQMMQKWDDQSVTMASGSTIKADLVYVCIGSRVNSGAVASGDMKDSLGPRGEVKVNEFLQVIGHQNVFAAGDVMLHPSAEIKQAYYAEMNGAMAAMNIVRHSEGQRLLKYPDDMAGSDVSPLVYVVSLGRYNGSLGFNRVVVNGAFAALVKWFLEWTKVRMMESRPIGVLIWWIGDAVTFLLSRRCFRPPAK
mmetsp:Transcript_17148/g.37579  ORF Transcript_17148/g.37579 Transcript_17148/m.37579 type:complete len:443 (-) Transcript_17148:58-1386(-)